MRAGEGLGLWHSRQENEFSYSSSLLKAFKGKYVKRLSKSSVGGLMKTTGSKG